MAIYGAFSAPILGMLTQSSAFGAISQNISNMNTGGYKASVTSFSTILATRFDNNADIGGVITRTKQQVGLQGRVISTTNPHDIAINGKGLFVLNTELDGTGEELYTRDGGFQIRVAGSSPYTLPDGTATTLSNSYLADKNGHFVQAWEPDADGDFSTSSSMVPVRLDESAFTSEAEATDEASLAANLPAESEAGDVRITSASVYDSEGDLRSFELIWTRTATPQQWTLHVRSDLDTNPDSNIVGASTTPAFGSEATYTFDTTGQLTAGTSQTITIDYGTDPDVTFDLDISDVSSIGQSFIYFDFQKNGRGPGELQSYRFDDVGQILGKFSNGIERALYKLPIATFVNPDALEARQGNLYAISTTSGDVVYRQVRDPAVIVSGSNEQKNEFATFIPFAHELSNSNMENEFTRMIMAQQAYNSSATVFKTLDEMVKVAADLKSG